MALPSDHATTAMVKQLKVLMPPSLHKLHISDELAGCFDASCSGGEGPVALVVSPFGKVWHVEVGRDGDGAFLGRGWAEFLAAHGVGIGWFVVLRHEGGDVLTIKAFDTSFCMKEFTAPAAVMASKSGRGVSCKPQFLRIIQRDLMEKMMIPARFVKHYVTKECLNQQVAVVVSPLGKFWRIELENDQSGVFFVGVWSKFLAFHGISEGDILLLRYEGNMVFKFKVFGLNGCQKHLKNQSIKQNFVKQETPIRIKKCKVDSERASFKQEKKPKGSMTSLNKASSQNGPDYHIGPPSWIKKELTAYMLERLLSLPVKFCHSIGFRRARTIMLKTAMDSTRSWQVRGLAYKKVCYLLGEGWICFCKDNRLKKGDLCTFNVIEASLWHVVITRSSTSTEIDNKKESLCSPSMERTSNNRRSSDEEQLRTQGSMISLSKASSYTRSVYEIGPPSWIKKEIKAYSLENNLFLAQGFSDAIGLRRTCTITLKTSINSTRSWQVRGVKQRNGSYVLGSGWKKFSQENELKIGDVCTFKIIEIVLWYVIITRA
ncbi:unnamed protein product [Urochloa humidicola]